MGRYLQLLGVLTILGLFPIKKMLISEWEVTVTDGSNNPIPHVRVSQNWQNYTLSISGGSDLYTNAEGKVLLGKYERRAPSLYWLSRWLFSRIEYGVHASTGVVGTVRVSDPDLQFPAGANCEDLSCTGNTITSRIRVSR